MLPQESSDAGKCLDKDLGHLLTSEIAGGKGEDRNSMPANCFALGAVVSNTVVFGKHHPSPLANLT